MKNIWNWIKDRLDEKSTWRGIIAVLTAAGVVISPALASAIIVTGAALFGLLEIFKKPKFKEALRGIIAILGAAGVVISPELADIIVKVGLIGIGLIEAAVKDK